MSTVTSSFKSFLLLGLVTLDDIGSVVVVDSLAFVDSSKDFFVVVVVDFLLRADSLEVIDDSLEDLLEFFDSLLVVNSFEDEGLDFLNSLDVFESLVVEDFLDVVDDSLEFFTPPVDVGSFVIEDSLAVADSDVDPVLPDFG